MREAARHEQCCIPVSDAAYHHGGRGCDKRVGHSWKYPGGGRGFGSSLDRDVLSGFPRRCLVLLEDCVSTPETFSYLVVLIPMVCFAVIGALGITECIHEGAVVSAWMWTAIFIGSSFLAAWCFWRLV
jgi:hypothetical protein